MALCKPLVTVKKNQIADISMAIQTLSSGHDEKTHNVKDYIEEMTGTN